MSDPSYNAQKQMRYRRRKGIGPRKLVECPSYSAYQRHRRLARAGKPDVCADPDGCRAANTAYHRDLSRDRKKLFRNRG